MIVNDSWFGPGDVVNHRVSQHVKDLVPARVAADRDYTFEGVRVLPASQVLGTADSGACGIEAYVGEDGQFLVAVERTFDPNLDTEWTCHNRLARTTAADGDALDPFEYDVRTAIDIGGETRTDRTVCAWERLGTDPIYGGREAQAAVLLGEVVADRRASAGAGENYSSLRDRGSLPGVIDNRRGLDIDWPTADALLGPDADTIAAATTVEHIETDSRKKRAMQNGVDFLSDDLAAQLSAFDPEELRSAAPERVPESWETLPADVSEAKARALLDRMRTDIDEMRDGL